MAKTKVTVMLFLFLGLGLMILSPNDSKAIVYNSTKSLTLFQTITTTQARDLEIFDMDGVTYIVFSQYPDQPMRIYRWDGTKFILFQSLIQNTTDCKHFSIEGNHYLAVTVGLTTNAIQIYKWDGSSFISFQSIHASSVSSINHVRIEGTDYLISLRSAGGSIVYRYENNAFIVHQTVTEMDGSESDIFIIGQDLFIATNCAEGNTKIFIWDNNIFTLYQTIYYENSVVYDVDYFSDNDQHYLIETRRGTFAGTQDVGISKVYRWNGSSFINCQNLLPKDGLYIFSGVATNVDGINYYVESSTYTIPGSRQYYDQTSTIYVLIDSKFYKFDEFDTYGAIDSAIFKIGDTTYLASAFWRKGVSGAVGYTPTVGSPIYIFSPDLSDFVIPDDGNDSGSTIDDATEYINGEAGQVSAECGGSAVIPQALTVVNSACQPIEGAQVYLKSGDGGIITCKTTNTEGIADFSDFSADNPDNFELNYIGASLSTKDGTYTSGALVKTQEYALVGFAVTDNAGAPSDFSWKVASPITVTEPDPSCPGSGGNDDANEDTNDEPGSALICNELSAPITYENTGFAQDCGIVSAGTGTITIVDSFCAPITNARINLYTSGGAYITYKTTDSAGKADFTDYGGSATPDKFEVNYNGAKFMTEDGSYGPGATVQAQEFAMKAVAVDCAPILNLRVNLYTENDAYVSYKTTGTDGYARFQVLPNAVMKLEANYNGSKLMSDAKSADYDVVVGVEGFALTLKDRNNTPIVNARVNLYTGNGAYVTYKSTDEAGKAVFGVLVGSDMNFEVNYNGGKFMTASSTTHEQQSVQTIGFGMTVTDEANAPIVNARVNLYTDSAAYVNYKATDESGKAVFDILPGITMKLEAAYMGGKYMTDAYTITSETDVPVHTYNLSMLLLNSAGNPIENARINLYTENDAYVNYKTTDSAGKAIFNILPDNNIKLEAAYMGGKFMTGVYGVSGNTEVPLQTEPVTVLLTATGNALSNVRVNLTTSTGAYITYKSTDSSGVTAFEILPGAEHKINATYNSLLWTSDTFTGPAALNYDFN